MSIKYRAIAVKSGEVHHDHTVELDDENTQVHFMMTGTNSNKELIEYWNEMPPSRSTGYKWTYTLIEPATG